MYEKICTLKVDAVRCKFVREAYPGEYNPSSTTTIRNAAHHLDNPEIELMLIDTFKEKGAFESWHDEIEWDFLQRFYLSTLYTIFIKFSYIPDVFPIIKRSVLQLFPDYKKNHYVMTRF